MPLDAVVLSLQDLIFYFRPPEEELEHEEKQTKLRSLRNRQNLFQEEVRHTGKYVYKYNNLSLYIDYIEYLKKNICT